MAKRDYSLFTPAQTSLYKGMSAITKHAKSKQRVVDQGPEVFTAERETTAMLGPVK